MFQNDRSSLLRLPSARGRATTAAPSRQAEDRGNVRQEAPHRCHHSRSQRHAQRPSLSSILLCSDEVHRYCNPGSAIERKIMSLSSRDISNTVSNIMKQRQKHMRATMRMFFSFL